MMVTVEMTLEKCNDLDKKETKGEKNEKTIVNNFMLIYGKSHISR